MAKVSVMTRDKTGPVQLGVVEYFGGDAPIHLRLHELGADAVLELSALPVERLIYVCEGAVEAGGVQLAQGSVIIIERGAETAIRGVAGQSSLLLFNGAAPSAHPKVGGHVHLLPRERAPAVEGFGADGVGGTIFANAQCPTCEVWLHENRFPKPSEARSDSEAGVHSHEEDEIIFVTEGRMQLGQRLVGPGTAIAIAAGTFYSFLPGPEGLTFINFRAGLPRQIHFPDGRTMDEVALWERTDRSLEYISPVLG